VSGPRQIGWIKSLVLIGGIMAGTQRLEAQVGLSSGLSQVTLVARVSPRGSIQSVSGQRESGQEGAIRLVSVTVQLSANTGYQLRVHRAGNLANRIWVRSANGRFEELTAGAPVTVASDRNCTGQWQREVQYRVETAEDAELAGLPVRYEVAINPTM
jgi:hypothetical protein